MKIIYEIYNRGESGGGILPTNDEITIEVSSGDPGGKPDEFEEFMKQCLAEWYDGAKVTVIVPF